MPSRAVREQVVDLPDATAPWAGCGRASALRSRRPDRRRDGLRRRGSDRAGGSPRAAAPPTPPQIRARRAGRDSARIRRCRRSRRCRRLGEIGGEIGEVAPVGIERVRGRAALGREHVEKQLDQRFVAGARPSAHRAPSARWLEQLVGRDRHGHLARLRIHKFGQRKHAPAYTRPPRSPTTSRKRNRLGICRNSESRRIGGVFDRLQSHGLCHRRISG